MGTYAESLARFEAQIQELERLANEAQACAELLRQQAQSHRERLDSGELTLQELESLLAERDTPSPLNGTFKLTEGLM